MPKKHAPTYAHTKPTYVHPSLQSSRSPPSAAPTGPQTVNQRIQQLRREQTPRATPERRDEVIEVVTQRTVPPALRRILHMAEVDAPPPKPGTRTRTPRRGGRPPPGPAAPSSWLHSSRHAPDYLRSSRNNWKDGGGYRRSGFCALARVNDAERKILPRDGSLVHHCLRTLAMHWEELAEYEQHYLPALSIHLKEPLMSYISLYGSKDSMDFRSFKMLFHNDKEVEGASGSEDMQFLDLTGLLNQNYTLLDLNKCLSRSFPNVSAIGGIAELSLEKAPVEVADSWEDEADESIVSSLPSHISVPIFPNLTRLSLAHPGPWASWTDLLALSAKLNTLTHLSLAYWPRPSTTPNAATTSMVSKHTKPISLGGSNFYSDLDDDWHEAANILRRLSLNTYCLRWLDLEGCTWHKALTWDFPDNPQPGRIGIDARDEWVRPSSSPGPDWGGAWRQIEYLNLFQGWIPKDRQSLQTMPSGVVPVQLMRWLRENQGNKEVQWKLSGEKGYAVSEWVEREKIARSVAFEVLQQRTGKGTSWCTVDHGWNTVVPMKRVKKEVGE